MGVFLNDSFQIIFDDHLVFSDFHGILYQMMAFCGVALDHYP